KKAAAACARILRFPNMPYFWGCEKRRKWTEDECGISKQAQQYIHVWRALPASATDPAACAMEANSTAWKGWLRSEEKNSQLVAEKAAIKESQDHFWQ
ncbi:hypothetical protein GGI26_006537, partial [Coemansia sp. RSA 1358]